MVKDREARRAAVRGVTKSRTRLSNWTTTTICITWFLQMLFSGFPWGFWSSPNTHYTINEYSPCFFGDRMRCADCDHCLLVLSNAGKWLGPVLQEVDHTYWGRESKHGMLVRFLTKFLPARRDAILISPGSKSLSLFLPQVGSRIMIGFPWANISSNNTVTQESYCE